MLYQPLYPVISSDEFSAGLSRLITRDFPALDVVQHQYKQTSWRYEVKHAGVTISELDTHSIASGQLEIGVGFLHSSGEGFLITFYHWMEDVSRSDLQRWVRRIDSDTVRLRRAEQLLAAAADDHEQQTRVLTRFAKLRRGFPPIIDIEFAPPTPITPHVEDHIEQPESKRETAARPTTKLRRRQLAEKAKPLLSQGLTLAAIAERLRVDPKTISKALAELEKEQTDQ